MKSRILLIALIIGALPLNATNARAANAARIDSDSQDALESLYASDPKAHAVGRHALAILVFPSITKEKTLHIDQRGEGTLFTAAHGPAAHFYTAAAMNDILTGDEPYGYALFFMNSESLQLLHGHGGWAPGSETNLAIVGPGFSKPLNTTHPKGDIYAFLLNQTGPVSRLILQRSNIRRIFPQ